MAKVRDALKIENSSGKQRLVNDTYERMQSDHNSKPCWAARSVAPVYIFHTGKSRWVISKRIDDGARCYAYIKDDPPSEDPSKCKGPWQVCDDKDQWVDDKKMSCAVVPGTTDKFVQLRLGLEDDMKKYGLIEADSLKQLWRKLDFNGNNVVSLAEIDKLVVEMTAAKTWPAWMNHKDALMRAYKKTILVDGNKDDWVQKNEFHALLLNLFWFCKLSNIFQEIDTDHDKKISVDEFFKGQAELGLSLSRQEAEEEFKKIDTNHGGSVLFVEFCAYIRNRVNPDHNPAFDSDIVSGETAGQTLRKKHGTRSTHTHFVARKCLKDFDDLEVKIKDLAKDQEKLKKMWHDLDYNGNGKVSLAEIDKFVVTFYPLLNHKPALMRAYKQTIAKGDDDWVEHNEFKALILNLFYFNKLFWLFDKVDEDKDRRLTVDEFKWCLAVCGCNMTEAKARAEFKKVDKNGGGIVLFDEFCQYFAQEQIPEAMSEWKA
eukprot:TRINITY_DN45464_c0_g1_i1.p2 TRINITY_DN45464_c0_g1~~TRINITY_DN45464_c0_g1_i1.p2  ORF type:complete len:486 (+),score=169.82 TRINITY_DN45464_c0_g1_i1:105-1562(+)